MSITMKTWIPRKIYLCRPDSDMWIVLNGLRTETADLDQHIRSYKVLTFEVDRYINVDGVLVESNGYELLHNHMELFLPDIGYFQMQEPELINDGNIEYKSITAYSCEKEFEDKDYKGLKINTGEPDSIEYLATDNTDELGFAKQYVTFYNPYNHELSLLHIVLSKVPSWSVRDEDIDPLLWNVKLQFNEDNINMYGFLNSVVAPKAECVFDFDILNRRIKAISKRSLSGNTLNYIDLRPSNATTYGFSVETEEGESVYSYSPTREKYISDYFFSEQSEIMHVSFDIKSNAKDNNVFKPTALKINFYNYEMQVINSYTTPVCSEGTAQWQNIEDNFVVPANAYRFRLMLFTDLGNDSSKYSGEIQVRRLEAKILNDSRFKLDTNIAIGLRNLEKNVNLTVDEDSISTRLYVNGADGLAITAVNFGDNRIFDISYYLNNNYMDDSLIQKVRNWIEWRDTHRITYLKNSQRMASINEDIDTIIYKVPNDLDYWNQWDEMREDLLQQNLTLYKNWITALQVSVDDNPQYDSNNEYIPWTTGNGAVDHDRYLQLLKARENGYGGYYSYMEYVYYVVPNILIALQNIGKIDSERTEYITGYETNWELYGIQELQNVQSDYESRLETLKAYSKPWSELTAEEKASYGDQERQYEAAGRGEYVRLYNLIGYGNNPPAGTIRHQLQILEAQKAALEEEYDELLAENQELQRLSTLEGSEEKFTTREQYIINKLMIDNDYTNSNIITTSLTDSVNIVDIQEELYEDAVRKLTEISQPQYKFTCDLENLLELEEFYGWSDELKMLNFIHVGIRDDYMVKMRVMGIRFNPCEKQPDLVLTFSNVINSRSGRTDINDVLDNAGNSASKNAITLGSNTKIDESFASDFLAKLVSSGMFTNKVQSIAGGVVGNATINVGQISGDVADFNNANISHLIAGAISAATINVEQLTATEAQIEHGSFQTLVSKIINASEIQANTINASKIIGEKGDFEELWAELANVATLNADQINVNKEFVDEILQVGTDESNLTTIIGGVIDTHTINAANIDTDTITSNSSLVKKILQVGESDGDMTRIINGYITTNGIDANSIRVNDAITNTAFVNEVLRVGTNKITEIADGTITTEKVVAKLIDAQQGDFNQLTAQSGFIQYLNTNHLISGEITTEELEAKLANIDVADITQLYASQAFIDNVQAQSATVVNDIVDEAYIQSAVVGKITAAQLKAGNIVVSDAVQIVSENGKMIMNGNALQIMGTKLDEHGQEESYVGVQLGYATNGQPSLVLRNEDGAVIVDPTGITADAVADGLIINNMIHDGTIDATKLNFSVMKQGDTINIEQVMTGSGSFGYEYNTFKEATASDIQKMKQDIEDTAAYSLFIETPNGTNLRGGNVQLNVKLLKNNVDVTDQYDGTCFTWTRTSKDHDGDLYWNSNHSIGTKIITITGNDVRINADFQCKFEYENITVQSD